MATKSKLTTIQKTLLTARLIEGFWERWLAHGLDQNDLDKVRPLLASEEQWIYAWQHLAKQKEEQAHYLKQQKKLKQAERLYRTAGLYYNLMQWIYPEQGPKKETWFRECFRMTNLADTISYNETSYVSLMIGEKVCAGRLVRTDKPKGVVIIINPLDSSKEELFTYEEDFIHSNFITLSFDGPGQGETLVRHRLKGTRALWVQFIEKVIEYAAQQFCTLPIYLFGTSSGASWAIYGSSHSKVTKTVAVSPVLQTNDVQLPNYFLERMGAVLKDVDFLPTWEMLSQNNPVFLFHGKKDRMIPPHLMYRLREQLSNSLFKEYEEEGHCCNFKLKEIRQLSMQWYMER